MCGIAGIVDFDTGRNSTKREYLESMADIIVHRGPDSGGSFISQEHDCGLSFRRLSIIDLSHNGDQPMTTASGRYTIVFNGEIYNHAQLRKELEKKGYIYSSNADTETILYGYMEYGPKILQKLHGMWGFAIWDEEEKQLFAARDRVGIKPFYYYKSGNTLLFASEMKSILAHPKYNAEPNWTMLSSYLSYGSSTSEGTMFQGIQKLPAAHYMVHNQKGSHIEKYWHVLNNNLNLGDTRPREISRKVLDLLRQSISDRMMSDVPFGVFLSGGLDSSLNVALMDELMDRPVDTFTVGFKELEKYNELVYARKIANTFKTNHHEVMIDHQDGLDTIHDIVFHQDEPNADPVCIPLYALSGLARRRQTTVIQVGEGSDEQFVGYNWMMRDFRFYNTYWKLYGHIPKFLKKGIYALANPLMSKAGQYLALEYLRKGTAEEEFFWSGVPVLPISMQNRLLINNKVDLSIPAEYARKFHSEAKSEDTDGDYLQRMFYLELKQRLAEMLLMRVDKMTMAHSLEARVPFLDHRILEYTAMLPYNRKVQSESLTKVILKRAAEEVLPYDIIYRKKMGFAAPIVNWIAGPWFSFTQDKLLHSRLTKENLFDYSMIRKMLGQHRSGKKDWSKELYSLLILHLWYERFM
ncbi:MAG: asparagine synthase (glutamine-hydrolyzing) [Candidatus Kapaibacteriales bacterium]